MRTGRQPPRIAIPGGSQLNNDAVVLCETRDGSLWAGTYGDGLWRLNNGQLRLYTVADGLSSNQIRSLVEGTDGTLWIGTFGGGLDALRNGQFFHVTARDGLLSDNVSHIEDDGQGSLWLSTTRGICRVRKQDIWDLVSGKIRKVEPVNYGVADGLRSAQCAPGYPTSGGGTRSSDGRLWFPTSRGLAVLDPNDRPAAVGGARGSFARGRRGRTSHPGRRERQSSRRATAACSSDTPASISALRSACVIPIGWRAWMASGSARLRGA